MGRVYTFMLRNRPFQVGGIILFLILANIVSYLYWNWGLITVNVTDAPLSKVIKSIEWQGWVKIYTNLPSDTKVTMYVDHVPLAEAMEALAANVGGPPVGAPRPDGSARGPGITGGDQGGGRPPDGAPGAVRGPRGPGGFGGRGGFGGGGAQWNLAFFVAPNAAQVKEEIRAFESGTTDDTTKVYTYPTMLQMVATDSEMSAADPRLQSWPGYKPAPPPPAPPPAEGTNPPPNQVADATPTAQTYLQAFAESANIWIMAPGEWAPPVSSAPPPNTSIISAVKKFVSRSRGSVTQAIILRVGRGGGGRGNRGGGFGGNMEAATERLRNAISGLPEDERADALTQLDQEVKFFQDVKSAPPEQQPQLIQQHMMAKMANNLAAGNSRRSPEKRAQRFQRMVANRQAATGKK